MFGNLLPDYLSLLETRFVLNKMTVTRSTSGRIILLIGDLLVTSLIGFAVSLFVGISINELYRHPGHASIGGLYSETLLVLSDYGLHLGAFLTDDIAYLYFFPAFFTSIWLFLALALRRVRFHPERCPSIRFRLRLVQPEVRYREEAPP